MTSDRVHWTEVEQWLCDVCGVQNECRPEETEPMCRICGHFQE